MTAWEFRSVDVPHNSELLRGLKPNEIDLILAAGRPRRFPAKSVMTYQGDPAEHLLLLWKGRARYFYETRPNKKLILKWITPGHIFGGAALVSGPSKYLVSTEAVRESIVVGWNGPTIRGFARRFPQLLENAHLIDMDYISWYVSAHAALTSPSAGERLASVLLGLARSIGQKVSGGIELDVTLTSSWPILRISLVTLRAASSANGKDPVQSANTEGRFFCVLLKGSSFARLISNFLLSDALKLVPILLIRSVVPRCRNAADKLRTVTEFPAR